MLAQARCSGKTGTLVRARDLYVVLLSLLAAGAVALPAFAQTETVTVQFSISSAPNDASGEFDIGIPSGTANVGDSDPMTTGLMSTDFLYEGGREQNGNANLVATGPAISPTAEVSWSRVSNPAPPTTLVLPSIGQESDRTPERATVRVPDAGDPEPDAFIPPHPAPEPASVVLLAWGTLALAVGLVTKKIFS
ncbi:MAG TPA: hypothetical protein VKM93_28100 [Terriglobia bacterium]|nr:hypothetical protein [Terriglobia bacterium]